MALTNAAKQARWRERHIAKRRNAQRIVNLLVRKTLTDEHVEQVAALLNTFLSRHGVRVLRGAVKGPTDKEMDAYWREQEDRWREGWLREHHGRTAAEYKRLVQDSNSEVWDWRRAKGEASVGAERRAWERDHPGEEWQQYQCGMTDREYTDYRRWLRQRDRKERKAEREKSI